MGVTVGAVVLTMLVCGGIGLAFVAYRSDDSGTASSATTGPSGSGQPSATPSPTEPAVDLRARATDPKPMTVEEAFPDASITYPGTSFPILAKEAPANCLNAASSRATTALSTAGCSQVVRATVRDAASRYVATVGVANMATEEGANRISARTRDPDKNGFFDRLSGSGVAKNFASPRDTIVGTLVKGHWLIFVSAGRTDGKSTSLDDQALKLMVNQLRLYMVGVLERRTGPD